jgi:hypothetical protein
MHIGWNISAIEAELFLCFGAIGKERFTYKLQAGFQRRFKSGNEYKVFVNVRFSVLPITDISMASVRLPGLI